MRCRGAVTLSLLAGLVAGAMAGDLVDDIRRNLHLGIFGRQQQGNLQQFTQQLGGKAPAQIVLNDGPDGDKRPFMIQNSTRGNDGRTFTDFDSASQQVCSDQMNDCSELANSGGADFKVSDCTQQDKDCRAANTPTDEDDNFLYFCG
ncbi:hypothetical protein F5Y05DRAFT_301510 [Hypoxylon sp. FL0543]|nr:hypothetical protein F5Y05DRAFT_301510 [Hypoxylon sp. FL0543]